MALTDYTSYASIRAGLGVSEPELPDLVLSNSIYDVMLREDLREINANLSADFITAKADVTPSPEQTRFVELVETYSAYQVDSQLLVSVAMFAPKTIKDSSSELVRVLDPYADTRKAIVATLTYLRAKMLDAYQALDPTEAAPAAVTRVLVAGVGLGLDPVTGA